MDVGTEELSHLEIIGTLARMHFKPSKHNRDVAETDPLVDARGPWNEGGNWGYVELPKPTDLRQAVRGK